MVRERIEDLDINEGVSNSFGEYAKYIILSRAIPDVRDGLKPVQRRILYSMYTNKLFHNKPYRKSAKTVGDVIGTLHPHGDSSVYEAMVRLSQEWKINAPLIDFHGNKGSIDGDTPAAMRYTESRLSKLAEETMFKGVEKNGVIPKQLNYDDTMEEPTVLPVKLPNLLINGAFGVSAGYATDIPSHNITEVLEAHIELLKKPQSTLEDILKIIPAPDFATGGVIVGAKDFHKVYANGKGKVGLRAKYEIEKERSKTKIIVTEIPYNVNKAVLVKKMDDIAVEKKVDGLKSVYDESSREGLRIVIEIDKNADERVVLSYLFKHTELRKDFSVNLVVIDKNKPKNLGLLQVIKSFNEYRLETRRKELEYDLERLKERIHIVEGFLKLIDNLDEVIEVIRQSKGRQGSKKAIMKQFEFTDAQATSIVDLQLYRISKEDKERYEKEFKKLTRLIKNLDKLLRSKNGVRQNVIKQYEELIEEFGEDRKSEIVYEEENWEVSKIDVIKEVDVKVCVTKKGYIKRSSLRSYGSTETNGLVEDDEVVIESDATTKSHLLFFTNKNNYMYIPVHEIKETRWGDVGTYLATLGVDVEEDEEVISAYVVDEEDETNKDKYILTVKTSGLVKRTLLEEHFVTRRYNNLYEATKRRGKEELLGAWLVEDEGYLGFKGKDNRAMSFAISEIAPKGLKTQGMAGMPSKEDFHVTEVHYVKEQEDLDDIYVLRKRGHKGVVIK